MVEYAAHIEAHDTVAGNTIDIRQWVAERLADRGNAMAGITTEIRDHGGGVVGIGTKETVSRMAVAAFNVGIRVRGRGRLADGHGAVVATGTSTCNTCVIKFAVRAKFEKAGGIVAVVAFGAGRLMKLGFTDRQNPVMALAAIAEHFLVIDIRNYVKTQRGMAGFAHAAGGEVIRRFPRDFARSR